MQVRIVTLLLFLFSFAIIALGGYQCSTRISQNPNSSSFLPWNNPAPSPGPWTDPNPGYSGQGNTHSGNYYNPNTGGNSGYTSPRTAAGNNNLPRDASDDGCDRELFRDYEESYGEQGILKVHLDSLEDFNQSRAFNFIRCGRIFLSLNASSDRSSYYSGRLAIVFHDGSRTPKIILRTGRSRDEIQHNQWDDRGWPTSGSRRKSFNAIFQDNLRAVILRIEDVRVRDLSDGDIEYLAAGEIYYKMFRLYTGGSDVCYSGGSYVNHAPQQPPMPGKKCWMLPQGPFSCLPEGAVFNGTLPRVDITGRLPCYHKLGEFYNLNIGGAFNTNNVRLLR